MLVSGDRREQIKHEFIVYFHIRHSDDDFLFKLVSDLFEDSGDGPGDDSSVLVVKG